MDGNADLCISEIPQTSIDMEIKKSEKANLENKKLLFTEIGLVDALGIVWESVEHSLR